MSAESLFTIANLSVIPVWLLLIVAPRWRVTGYVAGSCAVPLALGVLYAALAVGHLFQAEGGFGTLAEVQRLFANPWNALIGWLHYLAFDLFIGCWEVRNAGRLNIAHGWVIPCLVFTFLLGPVGLVAYFLVRWWHGARWIPDEGTAG